VALGRWRDQFPLPVLQGGGGTAANMNVNEVLASRATQLVRSENASATPVHPLDHVNRSQSTNDVYPTGLNIAVILLAGEAAEGLGHLSDVCTEIADRVPRELERLGRTCLQDALPVPIGTATHMVHAHAVARCTNDIRAAIAPLHSVPLGATAVGTGFGAPAGYTPLALDAVADESGLPLVGCDDPFDALANADMHLAVMNALCRAAIQLARMAQDMRFLSSGPVGGIAELVLPAVQVGSSAMPGKINPVIPELMVQISHRVRGANAAVEASVAAGELELNVMTPVIALELLGSLDEMARAARLFADRCIAGLTWNLDAVDQHLRGSLTDAVALAAEAGYATSSQRFRPNYPPLGS
jgi:aspartate ammonia-lyase